MDANSTIGENNVSGILKQTGQNIKFKDVMIGQPFFAHGAFWTRISNQAAAKIKGSDWVGATICDFLCDSLDERGEDVEYVILEV